MDITIRKICSDDKIKVIEIMQEFYSSPAVFTNGSMEIFNANVNTCLKESPYLEGFVFEDNGKIIGYGMVAKSFSTEFGKPCYWIEDIYVTETYRGKKIGKLFFDFVFDKYKDGIFRLEVEKENKRAVKLYEKCGFTYLPYLEMKK